MICRRGAGPPRRHRPRARGRTDRSRPAPAGRDRHRAPLPDGIRRRWPHAWPPVVAGESRRRTPLVPIAVSSGPERHGRFRALGDASRWLSVRPISEYAVHTAKLSVMDIGHGAGRPGSINCRICAPSRRSRSTSSVRWRPSSSGRCCSSRAARTRWSCSGWPRRPSGPAGSPSRSCTSTPATTSPRSSTSATGSSPSSEATLLVASVQESIDAGRSVEEPGPDPSRNRLQTRTLLDAITEHKFDAVFGGARRDEEKARAKERVYSFRDEFGQWDPKNQRPELWSLYNGRHRAGEHIRVFPHLRLDRARRVAVRRRGGPRPPVHLLLPPP